VLLCKSGAQQVCASAITPMEICSSYRCALTPKLCSIVFGKMHSPLLSAAVQSRLTAGLCQCNHTYGDLIFIQVCIDIKALQRCCWQNALPTAQCCCANQVHSRFVPVPSHLWRFALALRTMQRCKQQHACFLVECLGAKAKDSRVLCLQLRMFSTMQRKLTCTKSHAMQNRGEQHVFS